MNKTAPAWLPQGVPFFVLLLYLTAATLGIFDAGAWAFAGIGGGLILFFAIRVRDGTWPWPQKEMVALVAVTLAVMALLNLQAQQPKLAWHTELQLGAIFVTLMLWSGPRVAQRAYHPRFALLVLYAAIFGAALMGVEILSGTPMLHLVLGKAAPLTDYNRGISYLVLLAFPLMGGVYATAGQEKNKLWLLALFVLMLLFPASLTESRAAKLALIAGLLTVAAAWAAPKIVRWVFAGFLALCTLWPFAAQSFFLNCANALQHLPPSWRARVEIWDYMSYRIMERPYLGWGLGHAHTLDFKSPHGAQYLITSIPAAHPHNVIIELWSELGLPGLVLGLVFGWILLHKAGELQPKLVPFALAAWAASLCLALVAYNFWTDSLFATFALSGFAFAMLNRNLESTEIA